MFSWLVDGEGYLILDEISDQSEVRLVILLIGSY